ncbi:MULTISPECIES: SRPBCC family protein [unclassified Streptomyces]|uniref:SRPBCC family protein n=1 Tax=unclassified Streptomyces TaxID=2593676 RepID=UPI0038241F2A
MAKTEPQTISFADTAPYQVSASHVCPAPASAVFAVLKDNPTAADWLGWYVTSVKSTSHPEEGVGSTRKVVWLYGLGKLEERFIGWEDSALWSFTTTDFRPGIISKFVERVRLEPLDGDSCRIVYRAAYDLTGPGKLIARPLAAFLDRAIGPTLARMSDAAVRQWAGARG